MLDVEYGVLTTTSLKIPVFWDKQYNSNYVDWLGPLGNFVKNSKKLICLEITGYRIE
jgi:hypothetical protein